MGMTRRQFAAGLGAGVVLLPFMRAPQARAAGAPVRRIVVMTSLGIAEHMWLPSSAPGQPLVLPQNFANLKPAADKIILANGLSFINSPAEGHSTPQTLTGKTFDTAYRPTTVSIDQFIAAKLGASTKLPSLTLGVGGKNEGQHWSNGARVPPIDSPADAFQACFGVGSAAPPPATAAAPAAAALPRKRILDLVAAQIKQVQANLGSQARARLDQHLTSIAQLEGNLAPPANTAGCAPGAPPNLAGADPENTAAAAQMAAAHAQIIVSALACDVTRVVGMQFGISNNQFVQYAAPQGVEQHSEVHNGGPQGDPLVISCEGFLSTWFAGLVAALQAVPDPLNPGTTLLDNTLLLWGRDIGDGPNHLQYSMPYVLAGGTGYLKHSPGGALFTYGGSNSASTVGESHQRLLLNLADFMGITDTTGFGDFAKVKTVGPLTDLKL